MIPFAHKFRSWRRGEGLTQIDVAGKLGVAQSTVSGWEKGHRPTPDIIPMLVEISGGSIILQDFFQSEEARAPNPRSETGSTP